MVTHFKAIKYISKKYFAVSQLLRKPKKNPNICVQYFNIKDCLKLCDAVISFRSNFMV